jgi:signal transduction histidine kinase
MISIILFQYRVYLTRSKNLKYICNKLNDIIANNTHENLLVVTDDKALIPLLIEINSLLDDNSKNLANYLKTEIAMKRMLSNISHDLKTPLTVVLGYIEAISLDKNMHSEERNVMLAKVYHKANEVFELIQKFFDLARLESGDSNILLSKVNMNEICRKNMLAFYDILTTRGLSVEIAIPEYSIYATGNEESLDRVLNNLLSNAIKYGSDGKVIGLTLRCDEEFAYIDVWDKGKGIGEFHRDRVFERMYTLEDSKNKLYQESGLGLTITKRLVQIMGGDISLHSEPFEKTMFSVKLKRTLH